MFQKTACVDTCTKPIAQFSRELLDELNAELLLFGSGPAPTVADPESGD